MAYTSWGLDHAIPATEQMTGSTPGTGHIYKAVDADGTIALGHPAIGILQGPAGTGEDATVRLMGISKYVANAAHTAGLKLRVTTSGYMASALSGYHVIGRALEAAGSGAVGTGLFNFASPAYTTFSE